MKGLIQNNEIVNANCLITKQQQTYTYEDADYTMKFAENEDELDAALRLRYLVFNVELNEGLESSKHTGRDEDKYDRYYEHLIIKHKRTNTLIGTYRLQTWESACKGNGFYSNDEFDLHLLDASIIRNSIELGRACILAGFRNTRVLSLLWKGIYVYLRMKNKRYAYGCCSLSSQNMAEAYALYYHLLQSGHVDNLNTILPRGSYHVPEPCIENITVPPIPALMGIYLRYGAKIISLPALDKEFKTIDFFMLLDTNKAQSSALRQFIISARAGL